MQQAIINAFFVIKECPAGKPSATVLAAGVSGSIVLVGVVSLIIWKLITMWMDREEYNQFEAEKKRIQFDDEVSSITIRSRQGGSGVMCSPQMWKVVGSWS